MSRLRSKIAVGMALLAFVAGLSGAATADTPSLPALQSVPAGCDPVAAAAGINPCDTTYTPEAKTPSEAYRWTQIGGAVWRPPGTPGAPSLVAGSATPLTVDFYKVSFWDGTDGLAVGAACADGTPFTQLGTCTRYPAMWRYAPGSDGKATWSKVTDLPGADQPGYIGAVAWIGPGEALAVGGTGSYVRRECDPMPPSGVCAVDAPGYVDPAGMARAWLLQDGSWQELGHLPGLAHADGTAAPMRGFSAVACSSTDTGFCIAGGLGQLWMFRHGRFSQGYDAQSTDNGHVNGNIAPGTAFEWAQQLRFRVRDIEFNTLSSQPVAIAVTAGCCAQQESNDEAQKITWDGSIWHAQAPGANCGNTAPGVNNSSGSSGTCDPSEPGQRTSNIFSYEAVTISSVSALGQNLPSLLASLDGPPPSDGLEPSSFVTYPYNNPDDGLYASPYGTPVETTSAYHSQAPPGVGGGFVAGQVVNAGSGYWLAAGGGDIECTSGCQPSSPGDGYMDWAVGQITAGPNAGEAVAYTTAPAPADAYGLVQCSGLPGFTLQQQIPPSVPSCRAGDPKYWYTQQSWVSRQLLALGSYPLNGYTLPDPSRDVGWAVGDKGAIWSRGIKVTAGGAEVPPPPPPEPPPGQVGSVKVDSLSDTARYSPFTEPVSVGTPGLVPPLAAQPVLAGPPRFVSVGSPNPRLIGAPPGDTAPEGVSSIAVSSDGSEAWAVGPLVSRSIGGLFTLYHLHDGQWSRCDPVGIARVQEPDLECEGLASLLAPGTQVTLNAVATIPSAGVGPRAMPEFQAIAVGSYSTPTTAQVPLVLRFAGDRWTIDQAASQMRTLTSGTGVAFTAPDDGWLVGTSVYAGAGTAPAIYHFDGQRWVDCNAQDSPQDPNIGECGDAGHLLPFTDAALGPDRIQRIGGLAVAGDRVYLFGAREAASDSNTSKTTQLGLDVTSVRYPMILYHDRGGTWTGQLPGHSAPGALDPGCASEDVTGACQGTGNPSDEGEVMSMSVAQSDDGHYLGWATGQFGGARQGYGSFTLSEPAHTLIRLVGSGWSVWQRHDAADEYLLQPGTDPRAASVPPGSLVTLRDGTAVMAPVNHPPLVFDQLRQRWVVLPAPFFNAPGNAYFPELRALVSAMADDGGGGVWLAAQQPPGVTSTFQGGIYFFHYTGRIPRPVFSDVPEPVTQRINGLAGGPDGSLWIAADAGRLYRYDRVSGWDSIRIPGWDPAQVANQSPVSAVAVGADGKGVAVGPGGHMADLVGTKVVLDRAAGNVCDLAAPAAPCGTGHDLHAAAVAPDGSALVGGDDLALLWRGADGRFRAITRPGAMPSAGVTGIAMPAANRAWLSLDNGDVFAGSCADPSGGSGCPAGDWHWKLEDSAADGRTLARSSLGHALALRAIAVDAAGFGFAVGDQGLVLERTGDPAHPWRRLNARTLDDLTSVTLPTGGGQGALIGGENGLILTFVGGRFQVAEPANLFDPVNGGWFAGGTYSRIVGLAVLPGVKPGQVEAWAAEQLPNTSARTQAGALFHYTSDPSEPLLDGGIGRAAPLPDAPAPESGEIRFAAFGKSDCSLSTTTGGFPCPEDMGSGLVNEQVLAGIVSALRERTHGPDSAQFALYTGDVSDQPGPGDSHNQNTSSDLSANSASLYSPLDESITHERFADLVGSPLDEAGVPTFGAVGGQDLSGPRGCALIVLPQCLGSDLGSAGVTQPWRQAFADEPAPWGSPALSDGSPNRPPAGSDGVSFVPVTDGAPEGPSASTPEQTVTAPAASVAGIPVGGPETVQSQSASLGGAHTHYAFDVVRAGEPVLRVVVADSSLRSLTASSADQNPVEEQLSWLSRVLEGRPSGERAVVVSETPSYSYGPGSGTDTLIDSQAFEALMGKANVTAVVSGRLGWNGLYYTSTLAPGVHCPTPGGAYPNPATGCSPTPGAGGAADQASQAVGQGLATLAGTLGGTGSPAPPPPDQVLSAYPTVVAASAGGKFGPADQPTDGSADEGYWRGYTIVRIEPGGSVVVEQRPLLDWVGVTAISHDLLPGQHVQLHGFGREMVAGDVPMRLDAIDSPAITHRYDLVQADPLRPYLPRVDAAGHYLPLDASVATVNPQTGFIETGSGSHPRVYAVAILSVGDKAATWPIAFEPRRDFTQQRAILPQLPPVIPPVFAPAAHLAAAAPAPPPPPSSAPPTPPEVGTPSLPQLPSLSPPPPVAAVSPPVPPPPPPAPPPPSQPQPLPLALQAKLSPVGINASVVPPSPPPVNPAPPSGSAARKEAKQRQAATAKSEEGGAQEAPDSGDLANGPPEPRGSAMTRHEHSFTRLSYRDGLPVSHHDGLPGWSEDLLYGGGIGVAAIVLVLCVGTVRPTPRRSPPRAAPAWMLDTHRR